MRSIDGDLQVLSAVSSASTDHLLHRQQQSWLGAHVIKQRETDPRTSLSQCRQLAFEPFQHLGGRAAREGDLQDLNPRSCGFAELSQHIQAGRVYDRQHHDNVPGLNLLGPSPSDRCSGHSRIVHKTELPILRRHRPAQSLRYRPCRELQGFVQPAAEEPSIGLGQPSLPLPLLVPQHGLRAGAKGAVVQAREALGVVREVKLRLIRLDSMHRDHAARRCHR
mmetsp:Transcript_46214/g.148380  ORF Transcript_46214/g.148380 Transcript_46214/m.148380 type:complete len:222 (+) Transcript_46214:707-1372(+)